MSIFTKNKNKDVNEYKCRECGCIGAHYCIGKRSTESPMDVCAKPGDGPLFLTTTDKRTLIELAELDERLETRKDEQL